MENQPVKNLSLRAAALAGALTGAAAAAVLLLGSYARGTANVIDSFGTVFVGMELSPQGIFLCLVWGFLLGGLAAALFAWIYNHIVT